MPEHPLDVGPDEGGVHLGKPDVRVSGRVPPVSGSDQDLTALRIPKLYDEGYQAVRVPLTVFVLKMLFLLSHNP